MKKTMATVCSILIVGLIPCAAAAGEANDQPEVVLAPEAVVYDAASALEFFKSSDTRRGGSPSATASRNGITDTAPACGIVGPVTPNATTR